MNRSELEKEIIAALIINPSLLEADEQLSDSLFSSEKYRRLFSAITSLYEDNHSDEIVKEPILADKTSIPVSEISSLTVGVQKYSPELFRQRVLSLRQKQGILQIKKDVAAINEDLPLDYEVLNNIKATIADLEISQVTRAKFLSEVESLPIRWLWDRRVPFGMLTLLAGNPGQGKSFLTHWLAASISQGKDLPQDTQKLEPQNVLIINAEDEPGQIRQRIEANGGDLSKILFYDGDFSLDKIDKIQPIINQYEIKLLILDPLNAFLGRVNYNLDTEVRQALSPLVSLTKQKNIATIIIQHLNKKEDLSAIYRIGGSVAFAGVARSILSLQRDEENPERRLLMSLKSSYSKKPESLAFTINDDLRLVFEDLPIEADAEVELNRLKRQEKEERFWVDAWLKDQLMDGERPLNEILEEAKKIGIPKRTVYYAAKKRLGIQSRTSGFGVHKQTFWLFGEDNNA